MESPPFLFEDEDEPVIKKPTFRVMVVLAVLIAVVAIMGAFVAIKLLPSLGGKPVKPTATVIAMATSTLTPSSAAASTPTPALSPTSPPEKIEVMGMANYPAAYPYLAEYSVGLNRGDLTTTVSCSECLWPGGQSPTIVLIAGQVAEFRAVVLPGDTASFVLMAGSNKCGWELAPADKESEAKVDCVVAR